MILFDKKDLLKALNTELGEYSELADVIKFIEDYEKYHSDSVIRSEGRPILIIGDQVAYLTEEHIEALKEYERKKIHEEIFNQVLDDIKKAAVMEPPIKDIKVKDFEYENKVEYKGEKWEAYKNYIPGIIKFNAVEGETEKPREEGEE